MANCVICDTKLGFLNKPTFGQGKLNDGGEICFNCFSKNGAGTTNFKKLSTQELLDVVNSVNSKKEEVQNQLNEIGLDGISKYFGKKELNELHKILIEGEQIIDLIQGNYNNRVGVLTLTQKRLIFIDKGFFSLKVEDFPLSNVTSIQYETGFALGKIIIMASGNNAVIKDTSKQKVPSFVDKTRNAIAELSSQKNQPQQVIINQQNDEADQILKFAELKEKGIISAEEFEAKKKQLLGL